MKILFAPHDPAMFLTMWNQIS